MRVSKRPRGVQMSLQFCPEQSPLDKSDDMDADLAGPPPEDDPGPEEAAFVATDDDLPEGM
jgi:hypothetical protein